MRALLTETERRVLRREENPSRNYVQTVRSRVRQRLHELEQDLEILGEHEPELFKSFQTIAIEAIKKDFCP